MATHCSVLAGTVPWREEPVGQRQRVRSPARDVTEHAHTHHWWGWERHDWFTPPRVCRLFPSTARRWMFGALCATRRLSQPRWWSNVKSTHRQCVQTLSLVVCQRNLIYRDRWGVGFGQQAILCWSLFYTLVIQSTELDPDRFRPWFSHLPAVWPQSARNLSVFHFPCVKLKTLRPPGNRETAKLCMNVLLLGQLQGWLIQLFRPQALWIVFCLPWYIRSESQVCLS